MLHGTRDVALLADRLVNEQAAKVAAIQNTTIAEAVESVWLALESGLLRFANSDDHFWIEPCGSDPAERRTAITRTRAMLRCRKPAAPAALSTRLGDN